MDFNEKIGNYKIIKHGEVIVYKNETIDIEIVEEEVMTFRAMFVQENDSKSYIKYEVYQNVLTMKFVNFNKNYSASGVFEPMEVGELDNGDTLYFCCVIFTINANDGNRVFKYSFLTK